MMRGEHHGMTGGGTPLLALGVERAPHWTRADWLLVGGLTAIALVLRLPGLDSGLWIDEILTLLHYAPRSVAEIVRESDSLNNHVLYTLAAHFSLAWFGESAWALRLPALVLGVATIPALYHLGRQIASRPEALLATTFLALNYHHVWFSQNARGYTGLLLGAVVGTSLFIRLLATARPGVRLVAGYAAALAVAAWLHLTAVMVLLAHGLIWAALIPGSPWRQRLRAAVPGGLALVLAGGLSLLLNGFTLRGMLTHAMPAVIGPDGTVGDEISIDPSRLQHSLSWGGAEFLHGVGQAMPGGWMFAVVLALVLIAGVMSYARQRPAVLALLLLPAVLSIAVIMVSGMLLFPRFLFSSMAFFILLGVRGGFSVASVVLPFLRTRQVLVLGLLVALAGASKLPAAWQPKQAFEQAAQFLAEQRAPGDAVVCFDSAVYTALVRYLDTSCERLYTAAQLDTIEQGHQRVWLLYTLPKFTAGRNPVVWNRIHTPGGDYAVVAVFRGTVNGGDVTVLRMNR